MSLTLKYKPRVSRTAEAIAAKRQQVGQVVRKAAFDVEANYKQSARRDTGAQVASAYTETSEGSTYSEAVSGAKEANPDVEILESVGPPPDELSAFVGVAVSYAIYNEAEDGAMTAAVEAARGPFKQALRQIVRTK